MYLVCISSCISAAEQLITLKFALCKVKGSYCDLWF